MQVLFIKNEGKILAEFKNGFLCTENDCVPFDSVKKQIIKQDARMWR